MDVAKAAVSVAFDSVISSATLCFQVISNGGELSDMRTWLTLEKAAN